MSSLRRRDLLRGGAGAAGLAALGAGGYLLAEGEGEGEGDGDGPRAKGGPQNVIVVVIDNLRSDHLGAYGGDRAKTPELDALARQSLRFTRARPEAFPTVAARRAILTGRRSFPFRDWQAIEGLPPGPSWTTIAPRRASFLDLLGQSGFETGYVTDNPWILSPPYAAFRERLDSVRGVAGQVPAARPSRRSVGEELVRKNTPEPLRGTPAEDRVREYLAENLGRSREDDYPTAKVFRSAVQWLSKRDSRRRFALVVDAFGPHEPFDPPPAFAGMYGEPVRGGAEPIQPFAPPIANVELTGLTPELVRRVRELYAAEVTFTDLWLGRLLDHLDASGLAESTLVVTMSDHGVLLGEHGFVGKTGSKAYRQIVDVPLMIRDPSGRAAGRTSDFFASTYDIAPTVLSALGVKPPGRMEGEDLSVIFDGGDPPARPVFTASYDDSVVAGDGRWFLIADNQGGRRQLFDTLRDPRERRDISGRKPDVARRLFGEVLDDAGGTLPRFGPVGAISG
ncbi:MAG: sulfatase [Thermoleophilaceae bacterium]